MRLYRSCVRYEINTQELNKLLIYREKLNLTQEELAAKAGVSTRTIQRIEKGIEPKGYTLKVLAEALGIDQKYLLNKPEVSTEIAISVIKLINLSSLPFVVLPLGSIIAPLLLMVIKKQFDPLVKIIISLRIVWFICSVIIFFFLVLFVKNSPIVLFLFFAIVINIAIILINAFSLTKKQKLYISLNNSII